MQYSLTILFCLILCGCEEIKQKQVEKDKSTISVSFYLATVLHDEHLFILSTYGNILHHPNCPCFKSTSAEKLENPLPPTIIFDASKGILVNP